MSNLQIYVIQEAQKNKMEGRKQYKKWINAEDPIFFLNKTAKASLRDQQYKDDHKPKRLPRLPFHHFRSDFVDVFNNQRTVSPTQDKVLKQMRCTMFDGSDRKQTTDNKQNNQCASKHKPPIHFKGRQTHTKSFDDNTNSLPDLKMLTIYLDKLKTCKSTNSFSVKKYNLQLSRVTHKSYVNIDQFNKLTRRNGTNNFFKSFQSLIQKEDLKQVLKEVLKCYELMSSFDFNQDDVIKTIKDSLAGRRNISQLFLRKIKISSRGLLNMPEERTIFVNCLQQLIEDVRNVFLVHSHTLNYIIKEIYEYKSALQSRVIKRISQRISDIERSIAEKSVTLSQVLDHKDKHFNFNNPKLLNLYTIENKFGDCCKISKAQREVFMRLSEYFAKINMQ